MNESLEQTFVKVQAIIAELTFNDVEDITAETTLVEELDLTLVNLKQLIMELNKAFEIQLELEDLIDGEEPVETVEQLVGLVYEKQELD